MLELILYKMAEGDDIAIIDILMSKIKKST